jgi:hypothetical protein
MEELMAMALERSVAVLDHFDHERLAAGHVEGVDAALHDAQARISGMVMRWVSVSQAKQERLDHGQGLGPDEDGSGGSSGRRDAGERGEEERGNLPGEADVPSSSG